MDYRDYVFKGKKRTHEDIEWTVTYAYNVNDEKHPRVLLVGDSICNAYQGHVRTLLSDTANVTYWASSKCVTSEDYIRELDFVTDGATFDVVTFNNTCHSIGTAEEDYAEAYGLALDFIAAKFPCAKLTVVTGTPNRDAARNEKVKRLNAIAVAAAKERGIPVLDLYAPMDALDRSNWRDDYHFVPEAVVTQAKLVSRAVEASLGNVVRDNVQLSSATGPDGAIK